MDVVCRAMVEIAFAKGDLPLVTNLVNPHPVSWNTVMVCIQRAMEGARPGAKLELVSMQEWVPRLERKSHDTSEKVLKDLVRNAQTSLAMVLIPESLQPAVKLLDFFRAFANSDVGKKDDESWGLSSFDTTKTRTLSQTIRELGPIGYADAERWVGYWNKRGFFN